MEVCHLNDNPLDNRLGNLVYGTRKLNAHHAKLNGRRAQGEGAGMSKLSEREVHAIRHRLRNGEPVRKIAGDFDVHPNTVRHILHGRTWKHLEEETTWQKCKEQRVPAWKEKWYTSSWRSLGSKLRGFRSRVRRVVNSPVTSSSTSNDLTKTVNGKTSDL
ncbi:MAG: HNH endonuclease [Gammaproteobacteria bacterium]|nr:HNH endonuclease [Gammaproteobacteria bacterium]